MEAASAERGPARRLPGVEGVWVFIAADMAMFGLLFASFMLARGKDIEVFEASRLTLNPNFGGLNTLLLLTSSWFVALAAEAVRKERAALVPRFLAAAAACGLAFGASKAFEYTAKLQAGITMLTNDFYMYYFTLTGLHLAHVLAGTVVLFVMWRRARDGAYTVASRRGLECGATYWHMVDLLWIVLFPLLYLVR